MDNIQIAYPDYWIFLIGIIALIFACGLYFRNKKLKENNKRLPLVLGILRFLAILGILFLLLAPLLKNITTEQENPVVVIASDQSESVVQNADSAQLNRIFSSLDNLNESLDIDFDVVNIEFAENMVFNNTDTIRNQSTNISKTLEYISDAYEDQNLGAVILVSDGIYNEGKNPVYSDLQFAAPLHVIPVGDTTIKTDLLIKNVLHNRLVYLNDKFLIEADIQAYNCLGQRSSLQLYVHQNGQRQLLDQKVVQINSNKYFESFEFELEALSEGNVKYELRLTTVPNEFNLNNNYRNIYIQVLDARQKILLLADHPHPDLKVIRSSILSNRNFELDIIKASDNAPAIDAYDAIILHNIPNNKRSFESEINKIRQLKKPVLFITGQNTEFFRFNELQDVINISGANQNKNEVTPLIRGDFQLFTLEDELKQEIRSLVPVISPFGEISAQENAKVLLNQKIGSVETDYPLLAYSDIQNHKQAVFLGEGLWKWHLFEYLEYKNHDITESLIIKTLQYITTKEDKRPFRAYSNKQSYKENESINLDAQLYNANYEAINDPEAFVTIKNQNGDSFEFTFSKSGNYYVLNAGRFPEGNYNFTARTSYNGKNLTASGRFNIESLVKEQFDLTARHDLLALLANKHGGNIYYPEQIDGLVNNLAENENIKPVLYQKTQTSPLLNHLWLLFILIALFAIEWFLRRYFGSY